jgi:primosomal protein N'
LYFTEEEKEESRRIIRTTRPDEEGIKELKDFKGFLAEELAKRQAGKTVTNAA